MVDCHHQPCQGIFARQGLHCQSPVLKSWAQKIEQSPLAQFCWFVLLQCCFVWHFAWYWGLVVSHPLHQNCCYHHHSPFFCDMGKVMDCPVLKLFCQFAFWGMKNDDDLFLLTNRLGTLRNNNQPLSLVSLGVVRVCLGYQVLQMKS